MSRNTVVEILLLVLLQYFALLNVTGDWIDIAEKRPTSQSSTQTHYLASHAVDGNSETCSRTRHLVKQMWRVDLETRVWVVSVKILTRRRLSNVDIRIGDEEQLAFESNRLCRQGLEIKSAYLQRYDCAEPMLGKYVYISLGHKGAATLELCDVLVHMNTGNAFDDQMTYLLPTSSGKKLIKGIIRSADKSGKFWFKVFKNRKSYDNYTRYRKDVIIDLPPGKEMLKRNASILIPVEPSENHYREDKCGPKNHDIYINGTVLDYSEDKGTVAVKSVYIPFSEKKIKKKRLRIFHCSISNVRIRRANICDMPNKCGTSLGSQCDKTFISSSFPPGAYHCKCNVGFIPSPSSKLGMDNHVNPGERCIRKPKARFQLQHSGQNLASALKVTASSTDNFDGCKKDVGCKEVLAFGRFVVDSNLKTCFLSLNEYKPWLIVHLDDYRPVSYVRVAASPKFPLDRLIVSVGEIKGKLSHFEKCAFRRVLEKGQQLSFGCDDYLFGNAVKITTNSRILSLCEVEVYSYSYANVALQPTSKLKKSFMNDGNLKSCFTKTGTVWSLDLGNNVRVAVVFILHGRSTYLEGSEITVGYSIKKEICTTIPKYEELGNYFECQKPVIGNSLEVELKSRRTFEICEVEVFQTKTVNVAAKRPATTSWNSGKAYRGCDQKIDKSFITSNKWDYQWWEIDLMAVCKIHLVRIVTATGYKPADLKGDGVEVGSLDSPTAEPVQTIILSKDTRKRIVSLFLEKYPAKLQFREVEIYNGPLLVVDVCKKPDICGDNYKCVNGKKIHSCVCPSGFQITGRYKKCKDIDECASKNACDHERHVKNYHCKNTAGSYECSCRDGYEAVSDAKGKLQTCRDKDECSNPKLNECSKDTTCVNQIGRYICKCVVGYEADKGSKATAIDIKCIDTNECNEDKNICGLNSVCTNTVGSYHCNCEVGFKSNMNDGKNCSDNNECELNKDICGSNSVCSNTGGSYKCNCEVGYKSANDGGKKCFDIDECAKLEICGDTATCGNTLGSYTCTCPDGFAFNSRKRICVDYDECEIGRPCDMICANTFGSYTCSCHEGYRLDKMHCAEIDECQEKTYDCPAFSRCKNQNGSYECLCEGGYRKASDGTCSEICHPECEVNSYCQNGKCMCKKGFSMGLNLTCQPAFLESSGVSFHSRVLFLMIALVCSLVLLWFVVLL